MEPSQTFSNQQGRLPKKEAAELADIILEMEKQTLPVNIIFSDDNELAKLNSQFRNIDRPTDVLSFPSDPELEILGEIYISVDTARRQATEYGGTLREEILRLVCHGVLHLCGYDHHEANDTRIMKQKENYYLDGFFAND